MGWGKLLEVFEVKGRWDRKGKSGTPGKIPDNARVGGGMNTDKS